MKHVYLIVADETEEFGSALRYASRTAKADNADVAILHVMAEQGFVMWGKVEEKVKEEQRQGGDKFLQEISRRFAEIDGLQPILILEDGEQIEAILKVIAARPAITRLILGGNTKARTPGPLVSYFSGKGMSRLPVPLTIVPDHMPPEKIDGLV